MKALLVTNPQKEQARGLCRRARNHLAGCCEIEEAEESFASPLEKHNADFAIVFGGDGTVLNTVTRLGARQIPLITVNLGRLGFLAEVVPSELEHAIDNFLAGRTRVSRRMLLRARIKRGAETVWEGDALNEFAFVSAEHGRMCRLDLDIDGCGLTQSSGDGVIAATPTGSTGYALSAGGPILNPEIEAMLLVPICPHRLSNRPLVFAQNEVLGVRGRCLLSRDGRKECQIEEGDVAEVFCSDNYAQIVLGKSCGQYDILRHKLGWG